ncbi:MAG: RNA polymerase sigma factor [Ktedonobacterales bacterium]
MSLPRIPSTHAPSPMKQTVDAAQRWHTLLDTHMRAIYGFVYSRVGNREDAEQLTAQVFSEAASRLPTADDSRVASQLLCQFARRIVADHLRLLYLPAANALGTEQFPEWEATIAAESADYARAPEARVAQMLEHLPARAREVLTHRLLAGHSLAATADLMHLSAAETLALQYHALRAASDVGASVSAPQQQPRVGQPCHAGG